MEKKYLEMKLEEKYKLLGRMKSDCEYYLGRGMKQVSHLWGKDVDNHLKYMKELLFSIPGEARPKWLTYQDILDFSEKMDHRPVITAETLGLYRARFITLNGTHANQKPRQRDEVFFTIEKRIHEEKDEKSVFHYESKEYGYIKMSPEMQKIFDTLFKDRKDNRSIAFIEWDDSWNAVFQDGLYISSCMCRMENSEFAEWYRTISQ